MENLQKLKAEFELDTKKLGSKIDLSLAIIRAELLEIELFMSEQKLKNLKR